MFAPESVIARSRRSDQREILTGSGNVFAIIETWLLGFAFDRAACAGQRRLHDYWRGCVCRKRRVRHLAGEDRRQVRKQGNTFPKALSVLIWSLLLSTVHLAGFAAVPRSDCCQNDRAGPLDVDRTGGSTTKVRNGIADRKFIADRRASGDGHIGVRRDRDGTGRAAGPKAGGTSSLR